MVKMKCSENVSVGYAFDAQIPLCACKLKLPPTSARKLTSVILITVLDETELSGQTDDHFQGAVTKKSGVCGG